MSINEIEKNLPNGLHDAVMFGHHVDYQKGSIEFYLEVWVGGLNSENMEERERYKKGILSFSGVEYFIIEPPCETQIVFEPFSFSAGDPEIEEIKPSVSLPDAPDGSFRVYFFIYKLNAFMHICANKCSFEYCT